MANLEKKEILDKVVDKVEDKDLQMELIEDITDSFDKKEETVSRKDYDALKIELDIANKKYDDLRDKYISRFSDSSVAIKELPPKDEPEEKNIVDVHSIFR